MSTVGTPSVEGALTEPSLASPYDLLSVADTVRRLGIRGHDARAWLAEKRLIRDVAGRKRVIWGDVLAVIRHGDARREHGDDKRSGRVRRVEAVRRLARTKAF